MRYWRHDRIDHLGMREQQVFNLFRVDALAAATEHVVDPAAEIEETRFILAENIASVQPSIGELLARDLGLVVIAETHIRAANPQLAFLCILAVPIAESHLDLRRSRAGAAARHRAPVNRRPQRGDAL